MRKNSAKFAETSKKRALEVAKFDDMLTPEEWCKKLAKNGATVSARTLRSKARELGEFYSLGRAMMLNASHIEALLSADADIAKRAVRD